MRMPRIKRIGERTVYHCTSHLVEEASYLRDPEKEYMVNRMRNLAKFLNIFIIDYSIMSNHFHIIARTEKANPMNNKELLAKLKLFYGKDSSQVETFAYALSSNHRLAKQLRDKYLARIGDVSIFMKELKEGFTRWYNFQHERRGTLWRARFGSEVVEDTPSVVRIVAAYVDLNALRAWLVGDPKDYRFCGYAAALAGIPEAQAGLQSFLSPGSWENQLAEYRLFLFGKSGRSGHSDKRTLSSTAIRAVGSSAGKLPMHELLRFRIRYFTDGVALGSANFINKVWDQSRRRYTPSRQSGARQMKGKAWNGLCTMRNLRKNVFSFSPPPSKEGIQ